MDDPFANYSYADLQNLCRNAEMSAGGKREDLIARLLDAGVVPAA